eukprot:2333849-Amphidinium_carterae.1
MDTHLKTLWMLSFLRGGLRTKVGLGRATMSRQALDHESRVVTKAIGSSNDLICALQHKTQAAPRTRVAWSLTHVVEPCLSRTPTTMRMHTGSYGKDEADVA